jgi:hypothetical protein
MAVQELVKIWFDKWETGHVFNRQVPKRFLE